jgi:hypothetical protein
MFRQCETFAGKGRCSSYHHCVFARRALRETKAAGGRNHRSVDAFPDWPGNEERF